MMATFHRDGLDLAYSDTGAGPAVLFQHGLGGDGAQVAEVFPEAPRTRRLTLDCRGHGGSPFGDSAGFAIATFAADLDALAEGLGLGAAVVGGISMGAAIALHLAVRRPGRVRALILARPAWGIAAAPQNLRPYGLAGELLAAHPAAEARQRFAASDLAADLAVRAPDNLASLLGFFGRPAPARFGRLLLAIAGDGPGVSEAEVRDLRLPTLVIGNAEDLAHPLTHARALTGMIPGARFVEIPPKGRDRAGHVAAFRATVSGFLVAHA